MPEEKAKLHMPLPNLDDRVFWEGCKRHELLIQRCKDCGEKRFFPAPTCTKCASSNTEYIKASGKGEIFSFTTSYNTFGPQLVGHVPITIIVVKLAEGPLLRWSNLIDCKPEDVRIGMPVELVWDDVSPEVTLPKFRPAKKKE